jgi:hypothetical protein
MESTQLFNVLQEELNPKPLLAAELRKRRRGVNGHIRDQGHQKPSGFGR